MNELVPNNSDRTNDKEMYAYIKKQFDEETSKPLRKRNLEKIGQLAVQLDELSGNEPFNVSEWTDRLYDRIEENEKSRKKPAAAAMRKLIPAVCCAAIILVANCITVAAWDMSIFSVVIEFTKGGFSVDFNKNKQEEQEEQETVSLPVSEADPYGIIAECAKYDIYPATPFYLPDGFKLIYTEHNVNENTSNYVGFTFTKDNQLIGIDYERFWDDQGHMVVPSDDYNLSETTVNGKKAVISKEDKQYTIIFMDGDTSFTMFTQDVPYDECEKIVSSIR